MNTTRLTFPSCRECRRVACDGLALQMTRSVARRRLKATMMYRPHTGRVSIWLPIATSSIESRGRRIGRPLRSYSANLLRGAVPTLPSPRLLCSSSFILSLSHSLCSVSLCLRLSVRLSICLSCTACRSLYDSFELQSKYSITNSLVAAFYCSSTASTTPWLCIENPNAQGI